jgi:RNA polymerase sigma-70 factor, ECF subfamily
MAIGDFTPADLVQRIRAGSRQAEEELVERYSKGVWFVIRQQIPEQDVAEDAYQESFRLVLEKVRAGEVREPERLSGFISSLAHNVIIEQFRRQSRRRAREEQEAGQPFATPEPSQLDGLLREEQDALARQVLASLPSERDRKVLYRFYITDDDKDEICAELGVTASHFNQILFRARERYKRLFEEMALKRKPRSEKSSSKMES